MEYSEFGSDFHEVENLPLLKDGVNPTESWRHGVMFANGRQAINALIEYRGWKRIWIPVYFCYDIIESIRKTGIEVAFYDDNPLADDKSVIRGITFRDTDVLLRMNYFGLRGWRDNGDLGVEVIEDHSHALTGEWIGNSNAEWCIASLRKTLPISEGGVAWSPKGLELPGPPPMTAENEELSSLRLRAMKLKQHYLKGEDVDKDMFREAYIKTESGFENLPLSDISAEDRKTISRIDVTAWNQLKLENWRIFNNALSVDMDILQPEDEECTPFSVVVRGQEYRNCLIDHRIYPAILWPVPEGYDLGLLSIHCDGRYSQSDMETMITRIRQCLK